jgi:multidrug resistance efflux pump
MRSFVLKHGILVGLAILLIGSAVYFLIDTLTSDPLTSLTLATVDRGTVEQIVSVSGATKSNNAASLAFPSGGVVASVPVKEGDVVTTGTLLATLANQQQVAALARAEADVAIAEAALNNLKNGVRSEVRDVTAVTIETARAEVARVTATQNLIVENARRALYSAALIARAENTDEDATPPVITGTYTCNTPGTYTIRTYGSGAQSGYSMAVTGLENGTYSISTNQAVAFGTCGLFAQFSPTANYRDTIWTVEIPNTSSPSYTTLKNALTTAENTRATAIAGANDALTLALRQQTLENAAPVSADIRAAEARVAQARAGVAEITATLADRSIIAPFGGMVTKVDILPGETAGNAPVITLFATDGFEIVARIPEIDITKIALNQQARITFDATPDDIQNATVHFVSPLPTEIDGVSYYEVKLLLSTTPPWLRAGLNADVDIIIDTKTEALRIPRRFLNNDSGVYSVQVLSGRTVATSTVSVTMIGNDGFAAIAGLNLGDTIVAP